MQTHIHTNTNPIQPEFERRSKDRSERVYHWHNFMWWIALICAIFVIMELPRLLSSIIKPSLSMTVLSTENGNEIEKEAFMALAFGKVSATHELAISKASFTAQLESLNKAGHSSISLKQINQWKQTNGASLPSKPILLTFDVANRETMEIADEVLATLGMNALVFVDVNQLNNGNISLVSWHRLEQLVETGRWEIGISSCLNMGKDNANVFPEFLAKKLFQQRKQLEKQLHVPVVAANCSRSWNSGNGYNALSAWNDILTEASLQIGFVAARYGANYFNDSETSFRRIRVSKNWNEIDLLAHIKTHEPRRIIFTDTFQSNQLVSDWVVDSGEMTIENKSLRMASVEGEQGAMITLGGTEKWQDAEVEVQLGQLTAGQFWLSLRYGVNQPFIRLGVAKGKILLQETNGIGKTKQLFSRDLPLNEISLKLRVIGGRTVAYLNNNVLTERPVELGSNIKQGAFTLTVWNDTERLDNSNPTSASVNIKRIVATPIFLKKAVVAPVLEERAWVMLRQHSEELSAISPRYFAWVNRKPEAFHVTSSTMEIFAHYNRLQLIPALFVGSDTPISDAPALIDQAIKWASNPDYQGLNIVLKNTMTENKWQTALIELNSRMSEIGKILSITIIEGEEQLMAITENDPFFLVSSKSDLTTFLPGFLYPLTKEPLI
ncbi:MAG: hypothetical protein KAH20_08800 [Methylococcales bacterium]|nr:hypothetical protein [Methylococcales bacterium]